MNVSQLATQKHLATWPETPKRVRKKILTKTMVACGYLAVTAANVMSQSHAGHPSNGHIDVCIKLGKLP